MGKKYNRKKRYGQNGDMAERVDMVKRADVREGGMVEGEAKPKEEIRSKIVTWLRGEHGTVKREDTVNAGMGQLYGGSYMRAFI